MKTGLLQWVNNGRYFEKVILIHDEGHSPKEDPIHKWHIVHYQYKTRRGTIKWGRSRHCNIIDLETGEYIRQDLACYSTRPPVPAWMDNPLIRAMKIAEVKTISTQG